MNCPICLENPKQPIILQCCKNTYCLKCIKEWQSIRNICPLCCTVSGDEQYNSLKKIQSNEFDDGFLMLQTEKNQINSRIKYLEQRVKNKKQQFKNSYKSAVSTSLIQFLEEQLLRLHLYKNCMEQQFLLHNRANTVEYMQLATQTILNVQNSLDSGSIAFQYFQDDYDYDDQEYMGDMMDQYEEYDDYQVSAKKRAGEKFSKAKPVINQPKNKLSKMA